MYTFTDITLPTKSYGTKHFVVKWAKFAMVLGPLKTKHNEHDEGKP